MNGRTLRIENMAKSDYIWVIVIAVVTIITSIASIVITTGDYNELKTAMDETNALVIEAGMDISEMYQYEDYAYAAKILSFYNVFVPLYTILNVIGIINSVLLLLKIRISYQAMIVLYIVGIVFTIIDTIFCITCGIDPGIRATIIGIGIKLALIKMFWRIVKCSDYVSINHTSETTFRTDMNNADRFAVAPTPVDSTMSGVGGSSMSGVGGSTMSGVGGSTMSGVGGMTGVGVPTPVNNIGAQNAGIQSTPNTMNGAQPVMSSVQTSSTGGVQLAKNTSPAGMQPVNATQAMPKSKWICKGCGVENPEKANYCELCGKMRDN